jgi:LPXTG-site transpeptidase (sortase) family protein
MSNIFGSIRHKLRRKPRLSLLLGILILICIQIVCFMLIFPEGINGMSMGTSVLPTPVPLATPTPTVWSDPLTAARQQFTPVRLTIPKIKLDAEVISVGATDTGAMSTPKCQTADDPICGKVYWWSGGTVPGQRGNTVIAGHINRPDNSPASFGHLPQLVAGDAFHIEVANGQTLYFNIVKIDVVTAYAQGDNDPIINEIFGPASTVNVNLITCYGDWDEKAKTFDHRFVVRGQLIGTSPFPSS